MLYVSKVMFRPIPKRALSPGQISELREMLRKKIASPGKQREEHPSAVQVCGFSPERIFRWADKPRKGSLI